MSDIWLLSLDNGELLPALLSVQGTGDDDAALHDLGGYAHELEDGWALLLDDAWATFAWADGVLSVEVFSAHAQGAVLRRKLTLAEEQFGRLAAGVLVFTAPAGCDFAAVRAQIECGEAVEPLSIARKEGRV